MLKQILIISYSLISIIFGLQFATTYDSFEFLIPIALANMCTVYFLCRVDNRVNLKGMISYLAILVAVFAIMFNLPSPRMDELRLVCMRVLSVMFVILGGLAGGIMRYKFYQMERVKEKKESDGYERAKK